MEKNYWSDIQYLKEKLDAGADFVISQLFYDTDRFIQWVQDCRSVGITAPIVPGIMPVMTYAGFIRMTTFCKTYIPQEIRDKIEELKDDDAALKAYGVDLGVQMCRKILDSKCSPGTPVSCAVTWHLDWKEKSCLHWCRSLMCRLCKCCYLLQHPENGGLGVWPVCLTICALFGAQNVVSVS